MRYLKLLTFAFFALNCATAAQVVMPSPTPTPRPGSREAALSPNAADRDAFNRLQTMDMMVNRTRSDSHPLLDQKKGMYRRPGKEEIAPLVVEPRLLQTYADLLKQKDTGIVKLNSNFSCFSDSGNIVASEACLPFKMPGAGMAYSFRTESYRLPRLADLILLGETFRTGGIYQQVTMTEIGDVPLESLTLESNGLRYLANLIPARDSDEFTRLDGQITAGIENGGYRFSKENQVKNVTTYAMRSIAYRGKYMRVLDKVEYNELEYDKRRDVIVAFRVVDKDPAGNITIIWKQLKDVEAPILKVVSK